MKRGYHLFNSEITREISFEPLLQLEDQKKFKKFEYKTWFRTSCHWLNLESRHNGYRKKSSA